MQHVVDATVICTQQLFDTSPLKEECSPQLSVFLDLEGHWRDVLTHTPEQKVAVKHN